MAITYRFDERQRLLSTVGTGVITDEDLLAYAKQVVEDDKVLAPRLELIDCRGAKIPELTPEALRRLASLFAADTVTNETRVALVASEDATFGMARMYQAYRADSGVELRVFRTMEEARSWLGVEGGDGAE